MKPRVYHAYQEKLEVRSVGRVQLVLSTMKPDLEKATPDDVKILMTNAVDLSVSEVIELYSLRWLIEVLQGIEVHTWICAVQLPGLPGCERLGGNGDHDGVVPGA